MLQLSITNSGPAYAHLIPSAHLSALSPMSPETVSHLRWLAQKFALGQVRSLSLALSPSPPLSTGGYVAMNLVCGL